MAVSHRKPLTAFKSLLKNMCLGRKKMQNYFDYSSKYWLVLMNRLVWRTRPSATLRYAPGKNINILKWFCFLGWWSLVLFELSIYQPKIRCPHALFWFALPHSRVFWWITMIILKLLLSYKYMYFNKISKALWGFLWPTTKKRLIRSNKRVKKLKEQFFLIFWVFIYKKSPFKLWTL